MVRQRSSHTAFGALLAFALLFVIGAGEFACASDNDCGAGRPGGKAACGSEEGCALCGCSCHVTTVLLDTPEEPCLLVPTGAVLLLTHGASDGIPVSIVRPPA